MTIDEVIAQARSDEEFFRRKVETDCVTGRTYLHPFCEYIKRAEEQKHIAEWLEKLQYIENIILKWNADFYNDEDTGIPDNEILEAIFNACIDNGFDIPIDEDFKKGYNKAIDDFAEKLNAKCDGMIKDKWNSNVAPISWAEAYADFKDDIDDIAEQLKAGGENDKSI